MGGCRCYFRQCHVTNSKFPRMHFFRFPLKDPERYKKWRQLCQMEHMLQFSEVRRKNTSICARHFRLECFMNYKMERLTPNALPTIMRLSNHQALDFELDIENGVLVTLKNTKLTHLIPPDNFECPLYLANDKILLEKLKELESQYYINVDLTQDADCADSGNSVEYEEIIIEKPEKTLVNSVEILETIQVAAPSSKRSRSIDEEERPVSSATVSNKKCKILNITNCARRNDTINRSAVVLTSGSLKLESSEFNSDDLDFVDSDQFENTHELENNEQFLLTSKDFVNGDSDETGDLEYFEVHKHGNALHHDLPLNDSDDKVNPTVTDALKQEFLKMQNSVLQLKKKSQDFDTLQIRLSLLQAENYKLKKVCQENDELNRKLLALKIENNNIKKKFKDYKTLKDELQDKKLREEAASIEILKSELLSRKQEENELLETLKRCKSKEQSLKEQFNLELENERSKNVTQITKLKEELNVLKTKFELSQQKLKDTDANLQEVKTTLNDMENENVRITQHKNELEQSLNDIQNSFDIKKNDYSNLKYNFDNLQQQNSILEQKYWKLQALQNQESTVSTSAKNVKIIENSTVPATPAISANPLTKAQLFNGIKRYLSASMVSLLRMEMFGSSEREWKSDERQIALDILGLGETVYKYFTDEWRIRLPSLRDVRNWLSQAQQVIGDEEDL